MNVDYTKLPMLIVGFIILASYLRMAFNVSKKVFEYLPDSSLLIIVGLIVGNGSVYV